MARVPGSRAVGEADQPTDTLATLAIVIKENLMKLRGAIESVTNHPFTYNSRTGFPEKHPCFVATGRQMQQGVGRQQWSTGSPVCSRICFCTSLSVLSRSVSVTFCLR